MTFIISRIISNNISKGDSGEYNFFFKLYIIKYKIINFNEILNSITN